MLLKGGDFVKVVSSIWLFFQDQLLGVKWLNGFIGNGLSLLGLDMDSRLGGSVQFFLYDVIKITILLCLLIFLISYIQSYFPPERSKKILGHFHGFGAKIRIARNGYTILLMFFYPVIYRFYKRRFTTRRNFFLFDFFSYG